MKKAQLGGNPYTLVNDDDNFFKNCEKSLETNKKLNNLYVKSNNKYIPVVFDGCGSKPNGLILFMLKITSDNTSNQFEMFESNRGNRRYIDTSYIYTNVMGGKKIGGADLYIGPPNEMSINYIKERDRL